MQRTARRWRAAVACAVVVLAQLAAGADLSFKPRILFDAGYTPALADFNEDGRPEFVASRNEGKHFRTFSRRAVGLEPLFATLATMRNAPFGYMRASRDTRIADLDNDGRPDLANNVYWCTGAIDNAMHVYFARPDGTYQRSTQFDTIGPISGRGETLVAADFDNDGFLDLYNPQYTRLDDAWESLFDCAGYLPHNVRAKSWLLRNHGAAAPGWFSDAGPTPVDLTTENCGPDCGNIGLLPIVYAQPEGAQAVDYDEDGLIDLVSSGMLFRNTGNAQFVRAWPAPGVQPFFDEGLQVIDWNHDGYVDVVYIEPLSGVIHLLAWAGGMRDAQGRVVAGQLVEILDPAIVGPFASNAVPGTYGLAAGDINGDGHDDIIVNAGLFDLTPKIYLNDGPPTYAYRRASAAGLRGRSGRSGPMIADVNGDGRPDIVVSGKLQNSSMTIHYGTASVAPMNRLIVEVFGSDGVKPLRNQQGRTVRVRPSTAPGGFSYTRHVDGGSGYMVQSPYPVTVYSAYKGPHTVSVRAAHATISCVATPPAYLIVHVSGAGQCATLPLPPASPMHRDHVMRSLEPALNAASADPGDDRHGSAGLAGDFDGDGAKDLVWHNRATGETAIWLMQGATLRNAAVVLRDHGWEATHVADFDGDGRADLLWRNRFTGETSLWLMNGLTIHGGATILADPSWRVTATGDFNGDSRADLVWRNETTGSTAIWLMNGVHAVAAAIILVDGRWHATHVADVNGDGRDDIAWTSTRGETALWMMNGLSPFAAAIVVGPGPWRIDHVGDFDNDGKDDLLWHNERTGEHAIWLMDGMSGKAYGDASLGGQAMHVGDLDGDGRTDIIVRDPRTGAWRLLLMNGVSIAASAPLSAPVQWQVTGVADVNGDKRTDLVWRNASTGQTAVWLKQGLQILDARIVLELAAWSAARP